MDNTLQQTISSAAHDSTTAFCMVQHRGLTSARSNSGQSERPAARLTRTGGEGVLSEVEGVRCGTGSGEIRVRHAR
jgi:hypothetical protein